MDEQVNDFIDRHQKNNPKSDFFSPSRLSLTGERPDGMRMLSGRAIVELPSEVPGLIRIVPCICLASKQSIRKGEAFKTAYHYFEQNTLEWVLTKR